jgi:hypothetical protein
MVYLDYPPTLFQFADLCRDAKRRRAQTTVKLSNERIPMPDKVRAELRAFVAAHTLQ